MAEAYSWCNLTPTEYESFTPKELQMMVTVARLRLEPPKEPEMTNPEMMLVAQAIEETYANLPQKGVRR
jgi:hypothetical protein